MEFKSCGWRNIHCSLIDLAEEKESSEKYINIEKKRDKKSKINKKILKNKI